MCAHVHGFMPYLYVPAPTENFSPQDCKSFQNALSSAIQLDSRGKDVTNSVLAIDIVHRCSMYGYDDRDYPFMKVILSQPKLIPAAKRLLEKGINIQGVGYRTFQAFESNIDFEVRFMVDTGVIGCNWIECPPGKYNLRKPPPALSNAHNNTETKPLNGGFSLYGRSSSNSFQSPMTKCQIEFDISFEDIVSHPAEGQWESIAPYRILSFDIECANRKGVFPEAEHDSVIQIANMVLLQGETDPFIRNVFTLKKCAPIVGSDVRCFENEGEMLKVSYSMKL